MLSCPPRRRARYAPTCRPPDRPEANAMTAPVDAQTNWLTPQTELAALSDNGVHLVVAGASHQSLLDNQAAAAVSSQAITEVVDAARTGTPLD